MTETLYCTTGEHKWTRPLKQGRKPTVCPKHKHKAVKVKVKKTKVKVDDPLAKARAAKAEKAEQREVDKAAYDRRHRAWLEEEREANREHKEDPRNVKLLRAWRATWARMPSWRDDGPSN